MQDSDNISIEDIIAIAPHCDNLVLHKPNQCEYCDMYPTQQQYRMDNNINFTGENDPNKSKCPAEERRELKTINKWYGNTAKPKEKEIDFDKYNGIKKYY